MKNKLWLVIAVIAVIGLITASCARTDSGGTGNTLRVWSFSDEVERFEAIFRSINPDVNIESAVTDLDGGAYEEWVINALAAGGVNVPDVIFLEAAIVRHFVEGPFLTDLSDMLPMAQAIETYQFVLDIGTADGQVRAYSWQATPGAMFYRRSMAREIFGTDDPATIQDHFRDIPTALNSARRIRDMSRGTMFFTNHFDAFGSPFYANRSSPWIVNNSLVIDPAVVDFMDFAMTLRQEGLDARVGNWSPEWFSSMADEFTDASGNPARIFSFMLPTWGLAHVVYANHGPQTFGDWAIIPGPLPYQWGGTWIGIPRGANNPELARQFIETFTMNREVLSNWALGTYTHEYLSAFDPTLHRGVHQAAGDFVSSATVVREITNQFEGSEIYHFLGGQNPYQIFGVAAPYVDLSLIQGSDSTIQGAFGDAVAMYVDGLATRDAALASFRSNVRMSLPWVN